MNDAQQFGLHVAHRVGIAVMSILLLLLVLELLRRDYLKERYALLWLATSLSGLVIGIFPGIIVRFSQFFHFQYVTVLFVLFFLFTLGLVLSFSVVISRLVERNRRLTQEVALLSQAVERLEKKNDA